MNRLRIILKENRTVHEMIAGIVIADAVLAIIALFMEDRRSALLGVLIGCIIAVVFVIHMAVTIDDALCLDEKGAVSVMRKQTLVRYAFVCAAVALSLYFKIADPIFLVLSVIMIKAGAYMQPAVHKIFSRR